MNRLLDTNHVSLLQRNDPRVAERFQELQQEEFVFSSVVTEAELHFGAQRLGSRRRAQYLANADSILNSLDGVLAIDRMVARRYGIVETRLRAKGTPIPTNDVWIASIALTHDLVLVTRDAHFQQVEGLPVEDWTGG